MNSRRRWSVAKRDGRWRVIDRGTWAETYDTLPEAHTVATQHATADLIYTDGGLTLFARLLDACDWIYDRKATP